MTQIVIMPGGFHPFHAGHYALYQSAQRAFPRAEVFVAATNDTSTRPFPFPVKEKLAKLAGVEPGHFVQVKSPFRAEEITSRFDPAKDVLIFVRSEKDADKPPQAGGVKRDGSPSYLQPLQGQTRYEPFAKHAYMAYLPTVEFGPGMTSATEIRGAWPQLNDKRKTALVMSLYPRTQGNTKLAATVVGLLDAAIGSEQGVAEGLSKRDQKDVAAIRAAIERLQAQLSHPNADRAAIQQSIEHERKRLALYKQGVAEGAPIVVAQAPIDVRNPKKAAQPYRNQGDIVPDTKPPSTEKRGVKGRPGQRPMPKYDEGMAEGLENFNGVQLSLEIQKDDEFVDDDDTDNQTIFVQATANGRELGQVVFAIDYDAKGMILVPQDLEVDERFRGQGIAATMYDYVKRKGYRIRRSDDQTPAGAAFWDKHKSGQTVWEQGMAEAAKKCPPATQDIGINLENRQKAIDEYGYGPLNPDLPNTKFWMKKVSEWNLDSMEEAQQSLCGNCAAFDIRQDTLDCIAQGIDSDNPEDAEGVIDAGDMGYCKFLKFKCASRRTCDAWVTGGPLQDKPMAENQGWAATLEEKRQGNLDADPELKQAKQFAVQHYPEFANDPDMAFDKWVQRSLEHGQEDDQKQFKMLQGVAEKVKRLEQAIAQARAQQSAVQESDYIEEKWSQKYKSSINCANPKGFSQKAHCAGRKK